MQSVVVTNPNIYISVTALRQVYVSLESPLCPSVCLYAERIFTTIWRNFAKKKISPFIFH